MKSKMCRLPTQHVLQRGWSRFWARVEKRGADECWPWKGAKTSRGYGAFGCGGKQWQAHRFAYAVMNGEFPDFLEVRHMCEERYPVGDFRARLCCNPAHLQTGTHLENMRDKLTSGRIVPSKRIRSSKREQPIEHRPGAARHVSRESIKQWLDDRRKEG